MGGWGKREGRKRHWCAVCMRVCVRAGSAAAAALRPRRQPGIGAAGGSEERRVSQRRRRRRRRWRRRRWRRRRRRGGVGWGGGGLCAILNGAPPRHGDTHEVHNARFRAAASRAPGVACKPAPLPSRAGERAPLPSPSYLAPPSWGGGNACGSAVVGAGDGAERLLPGLRGAPGIRIARAATW